MYISHSIHAARIVALLLATVVPIILPGPVYGATDADAVYQLLDLFDDLADARPDYESARAVLDNLPQHQRDSAVSILIDASLAQADIAAAIDRLLSLPAYVHYYRQASNMSADVHRRILAALPIARIDSPADISGQLLELFEHRGQLRTWLGKVLPKIDVDSAVRIAKCLLPPGDYHAPTIYFMYDGNFGAFARDSAVVFDLYGVIVGKLPRATRFDDLSTIGSMEFTDVVAHELFHVFSGDRLYTHALPDSAGWRAQQRRMLLLRMVSEGLAMHCNPPTGLSLATKTDTAIVAHWTRELNHIVARLAFDSSLSIDDYLGWLRGTYHDDARSLLDRYLKSRYDADSARALLLRSLGDRPSLVYTLGWWMASRVSENGRHPERLIPLPDDPIRLIEQYNSTVEPAADSLKIRW